MKISFYLLSFLFLVTISKIFAKKSNKRAIEEAIIKSCIILQRDKFEKDQKNFDLFVKGKSKEINQNEEKFVILMLAFCYYKNDLNTTLKILKDYEQKRYIDLKDEKVLNLYKFEYYDYDNNNLNKKNFNNFVPIFQRSYAKKGDYDDEDEDDSIYFIHTPFFKVFILYIIVNSVYVIVRRIRNPPDPSKIPKNDITECECPYHRKLKEQEELLKKEKEKKENKKINENVNEIKIEKSKEEIEKNEKDNRKLIKKKKIIKKRKED